MSLGEYPGGGAPAPGGGRAPYFRNWNLVLRGVPRSLMSQLKPDFAGIAGSYRPAVLGRRPVMPGTGFRQFDRCRVEAPAAGSLRRHPVRGQSTRRINANLQDGGSLLLRPARGIGIVIVRMGKRRPQPTLHPHD